MKLNSRFLLLFRSFSLWLPQTALQFSSFYVSMARSSGNFLLIKTFSSSRSKQASKQAASTNQSFAEAEISKREENLLSFHF